MVVTSQSGLCIGWKQLMRNGYKVMAYRLKKTDDSATIDSILVEDRHVDDSGELDLMLENMNEHEPHLQADIPSTKAMDEGAKYKAIQAQTQIATRTSR